MSLMPKSPSLAPRGLRLGILTDFTAFLQWAPPQLWPGFRKGGGRSASGCTSAWRESTRQPVPLRERPSMVRGRLCARQTARLDVLVTAAIARVKLPDLDRFRAERALIFCNSRDRAFVRCRATRINSTVQGTNNFIFGWPVCRPSGVCPLLRSLLGVKRTCRFALHMSAYDPKRTSGVP